MLYAGNKTAVLIWVARTVFEVRGLSVHRGKAADRENGGSALPLAQRWEDFRIA